MRALSLHRFLLRFALAGASLFAWMFLFQVFYLMRNDGSFALAQTAMLYALASLVTVLMTPLAAKALRNGLRRMIVYALTLLACAFVIIGATFEGYWGEEYIGLAIAAFGILFGMYRAFYWIPYTVEAVAGGHRRSLVGEVVIALAPMISGILIALFVTAPIWLFYVAAALVALSAFPLLALADTYEGYSWGYRQTFHELLSRTHREYVSRAILEGISGGALLLFWPLAIFVILGRSYALLGAVLTLTFLVAIFFRAPIRRLLRWSGSRDSRFLIAVFALTPWLFRLLVATPLGIATVDSYFYTTTARRQGIDPFAFEQTTDGGSLLDEHTALKEMALHIGRVAICFIGAFASLAFTAPAALVVVFTLAAIASVVVALR